MLPVHSKELEEGRKAQAHFEYKVVAVFAFILLCILLGSLGNQIASSPGPKIVPSDSLAQRLGADITTIQDITPLKTPRYQGRTIEFKKKGDPFTTYSAFLHETLLIIYDVSGNEIERWYGHTKM